MSTQSHTRIPRASFLLCPVCNKPVSLESAKTDEHGRAIHEDCYVLALRLKQATNDTQN
jgi:hypothetical protein